MSRCSANTVIVLLGMAILSACVSRGDIQRANDRLEAVWRSENAVTLREYGSQVLDITMEEAMRVTEQSLYDIGFDRIEVDRGRGLVRGERRLTNEDISEEARRREEPRMRRIAVEEVGPLIGNSVGLDASGSTLMAEVVLRNRNDGVLVSARDVWIEHAEGRAEGLRLNNQVDPTSLKAGMYEFSQALARNAEAVRTERTDVAVPRKSPSQWILPPADE